MSGLSKVVIWPTR